MPSSLISRIAEGQTDQNRIEAILTTGAAVANASGSIPAGGVGVAAGAWSSAADRDTAITTMLEIETQLNALLAELRKRKIIAT